MLTKIKNLAKKLYFHHKLEKSKNNPKNSWNLLRPFCLPTHTSFFTPSSSTVKIKIFTNATNIVNQLNHHFVNIDIINQLIWVK